MKENRYVFVYSTRSEACKSISYLAPTYKSALRRFRKNVRYVGEFDVYSFAA